MPPRLLNGAAIPASFTVAAEVGAFAPGIDDHVQTSFGLPGFGSLEGTQSFFGIDGRLGVPLGGGLPGLAVGAKVRTYGGDAGEIHFNFHPTPGDDTSLKYRRNSSAMFYVGTPLNVGPSILPAAQRIVLTPYVGGVIESGTWTLRTDESGGGGILNVFEEDKTRNGFVVGFDFDAYLAPFANGMQPFLRVGAQINFMSEVEASARSTLGFDYHFGAGSDPDVGVRIGAGVSISDIRLKRDIAPIGRLGTGVGLYRYRYIWSDDVYVGVMAQEVAEIMPDAVVRGTDGYLRVDYRRLGLRLMTWGEWTRSPKAQLASAAR